MNILKNFAPATSSIDVEGKRVLIRADFNVPLKQNNDGTVEVRDIYRIRSVIPTINNVIMRGGIPILMTHFSDDEGKAVPMAPGQFQTTEILVDELKTSLGIKPIHCCECVGDQAEEFTKNAQPGMVVLLENLRKEKGEKKDDPDFCRILARNGDIYCNDAFGVCHRKHASVHGIVNHFPKECVTSGTLLRQEIRALHYRLIERPTYPMSIFIGGSKLSTKSKVIKKFLERSNEKECDVFLIGKLAREFARYHGLTLMGPMPDQEIIEIINSVDITNPRLHIARGRIYHEKQREVLADYHQAEQTFQKACELTKQNEGKIDPETAMSLMHGLNFYKNACEEIDVYDIDDESVEKFLPYIERSETIMVNGPAGFFENSRNTSTVKLLRAIANNKSAYSIVGGGETNSVLAENNLQVKYISTGGGAFLDFVAGETLPGLEALGYYNQ